MLRYRDQCLAGTEYIVLENLTGSYNKPCILDLKMGTRYICVIFANLRLKL